MRQRLSSHHPAARILPGVLVALVCVLLMAAVRLGLLRGTVLPIGYGVPIVIIAYFRNRPLLWAAFGAFTAISVIKLFGVNDLAFESAQPLSRTTVVLMVEFDLLCVTGMGHLWISLQKAADERNAELSKANAELVKREDEIARQNEEVLAQATELERQSEELRIANQRLQEVLQTAPLALVISNIDGTDVRVNPAAAALFQVSPDSNVAAEMGHGNWRLFQNDRQLSKEQFPLPRAVHQGLETRQEEFGLHLADGSRKSLLINARPIHDEGARIVGAVAALTDITPQKTMQQEIDLRRQEAEEANLRKTRFLAAVSHDVRTPANAICLLADLMRRTAADPSRAAEIPELAQELHAGAISLVNLLNDVLDVARFDSGGVEIQISEFSVRQLMEEERGRLAPLAREQNLAYHWVLPDDPIWLRTDRVKLARVLGNLVGNALKFTDQGEVRVEATHNPKGGVDIRVVDTGIGIRIESQRQIFDEFFQLRNPERDRTKGSGLGLSICSRLAQAIGATVTVKSATGEGSTFTVTLPAQSVIDRPAASATQDHQA